MIHGYCSPSSALIVIAALAAAPELLMAQATRDLAMPERVQFGSADGKTTLVGYVFKSAVQPGVRVPAVVMMHGRAGPYSSLAKGVYDATTLSQRHQFWGRLWVAQGYIAILVDGFGPRGYPQGFGRHTYASRPAELDEVSARPLDAYGALAYLRSRPDVLTDRPASTAGRTGEARRLRAWLPMRPALTGMRPTPAFALPSPSIPPAD